MSRQPFRAGLLSLDPVRLIGGQCTACQARSYPLRLFCAACRDGEIEQTHLSSRGTVYTFTVVRQAPTGVAVPYVLAYVDLDDGVRVMTQVKVSDLAEIEIGLPVTLTERAMGRAEDGTELIGYQFAPSVERMESSS